MRKWSIISLRNIIAEKPLQNQWQEIYTPVSTARMWRLYSDPGVCKAEQVSLTSSGVIWDAEFEFELCFS